MIAHSKKNNLASFIKRYWPLLVLFVVSLSLTQPDALFDIFGTVIYLPLLLSGAVLGALLARHLFYADSLDEDAHSGFFVAAWKLLSPRERVFANLTVTCVLIVVAGIIAAALVK